MVIAENEVYVCSESFSDIELIRRSYYSSNNLATAPFTALVESLKKSSESPVSAMIFVNGVLYLAAKGGAEVKIIRNKIPATLLLSSDQNVISASGYPKEGDKMILQIPNQNISPVEFDFILPKKEFKIDFKKFFPGSIYVKKEFNDEVSPQSKKLTFTVALILLVILGVSIGFGIKQKNTNDLKNKYLPILSSAQQEIDQAISLATVDPNKSRDLFNDVKLKLNQIDSLKVKDSKIEVLRQKINDSRSAILGEFVATPSMFLDLTLLSSGFKGDKVCFSGGTIYVADTKGTRVVSINLENKKSKVIAGPAQIGSVIDIACYEDKVFVVENDGVYEITNDNTKIVNKTWSGEAFLNSFAGNLYITDKSGNAIYRYQGSNDSYGEKQNWLATGTIVNFSNIDQVVVDGSIYVLYPNSKILKFGQGSPQTFSIRKVSPDIGNIDAIYTNSDNQNLYLLDKVGNRVVVVDKNGAYKAQYLDKQISQAINLIVSEADKKIILLTGDKLFSVELSN